ncbi:MAG: hypothetical protein WD872_09260 [Pirellulaceae bacterium]
MCGRLEAAAIEAFCRELNYAWRDRLLGPVVTVHAFLLQMLHGNTACDHVPHPGCCAAAPGHLSKQSRFIPDLSDQEKIQGYASA